MEQGAAIAWFPHFSDEAPGGDLSGFGGIRMAAARRGITTAQADLGTKHWPFFIGSGEVDEGFDAVIGSKGLAGES